MEKQEIKTRLRLISRMLMYDSDYTAEDVVKDLNDLEKEITEKLNK